MLTVKKYKNLDIHKAVKIILGINYNFKWLDVCIMPQCVTWFCAVQFRNDPERKWLPRIVMFYPGAQKISVRTTIGDAEPTFINAETLVIMAEGRAQSPRPPFKPAV